MPSLPERIIGHEKQCGQLLLDISKGNVAHAYLFAGPKHLGKFTIARWFARQLLCDGKSPEERTRITSAMERLIDPDFLSMDMLWVEDVSDDWSVIAESSNVPQEHRSKAPAAKTDTISIEDVRALSERLCATGPSRYLCCIIRSVERMHTAAANSFLKLLEEPPKRVVFILTTEDLSALLPTITSRTRILHFQPLREEALQPLLHGNDDDRLALHLAHGAPGSLIRLLADPETLRLSKQLHAQARQFWQAASAHERLSLIMPLTSVDEKKHLRAFIEHLGLTLREHPDTSSRSRWMKAYAELTHALETNAHKPLILQRFALAVSNETWYDAASR